MSDRVWGGFPVWVQGVFSATDAPFGSSQKGVLQILFNGYSNVNARNKLPNHKFSLSTWCIGGSTQIQGPLQTMGQQIVPPNRSAHGNGHTTDSSRLQRRNLVTWTGTFRNRQRFVFVLSLAPSLSGRRFPSVTRPSLAGSDANDRDSASLGVTSGDTAPPPPSPPPPPSKRRTPIMRQLRQTGQHIERARQPCCASSAVWMNGRSNCK